MFFNDYQSHEGLRIFSLDTRLVPYKLQNINIDLTFSSRIRRGQLHISGNGGLSVMLWFCHVRGDANKYGIYIVLRSFVQSKRDGVV